MRKGVRKRALSRDTSSAGVLAPMLLGLIAFVAAGLTMIFALSPGALVGERDRLASLIEDLRQDRQRLAEAAAAPAPDTTLTTGSVGSSAQAEVPATATLFGAELARADTVRGLRQKWFLLLAIDRSLADHEARIVLREASDDQMLNLVVGPFANAADAATVCARLAAAAPDCIPAKFDGPRLPGATAKSP